MNISEIINQLKQNLILNLYLNELDEINKIEASGATGGEIFDQLLAYLYKLKSEKPNIYSRIQEQTELIFSYAKTIGR